ncbi:hypothetical protein BC830DRAFT_1163931 [Chytriomyces sp. MP71]|nr:hypothetical protein BC830DRAFT_1163931 [Chytriomyces sp. MP71]
MIGVGSLLAGAGSVLASILRKRVAAASHPGTHVRPRSQLRLFRIHRVRAPVAFDASVHRNRHRSFLKRHWGPHSFHRHAKSAEQHWAAVDPTNHGNCNLHATLPFVKQRIPISTALINWAAVKSLRYLFRLTSFCFAMFPNFIPSAFLPAFSIDVAHLTASQGGCFVLIPVIVAQLFGIEQLGSLLGLSFSVGSVGYLAGPPLAGAIKESFGDTGVTFFAGILTLISAFMSHCSIHGGTTRVRHGEAATMFNV